MGSPFPFILIQIKKGKKSILKIRYLVSLGEFYLTLFPPVSENDKIVIRNLEGEYKNFAGLKDWKRSNFTFFFIVPICLVFHPNYTKQQQQNPLKVMGLI